MQQSLVPFSEPVREWFRQTFGQPTPPQAEGWPAIQRGEHTLILAPTGSGKTLAAFLWGIDRIYRELMGDGREAEWDAPAGVRLLYVSPLKALNNDIERNLRAPLAGIRATATSLGHQITPLHVAVRTGDTPSKARTQMLAHPPHILITTPESLYLMLTAPRAREMFRTVHTVIVDEIHTLCGNKRGVHLSLTLERLDHLASARIQRIGLSATQKPLEEVANYLGGQEPQDDGSVRARPVTIVDSGYRKPLDLKVVTVVEDFRKMPGDTVWPSIIARLLGDIRRRRSTLVFANNRRLAERTADRLNAQLAAEETEEIPPGSTEALAPRGVVRDRGIFALGAAGPIRAHHGSISKEARREMEEDLKAGKLPALVGTSSLELGIDIGAVDQVAQLGSPKSVAQGLQRVGRSGHMVGQTSIGRIYATHREDLLEAAAVARGMLEGEVEPTYTPRNPLDILAQQIVAMVSVEEWDARELYDLVKRAYAYRDLSWGAYLSVVEMLAGKFYGEGDEAGRRVAALRPRISWDRVHGRLAALPGTRLLTISNAGTIPDSGAFRVYLGDGKTRIGELDEEFVFETHPGDVFLLGSQVWRVHEIRDDRVIVAEASGSVPRMPFWNGDYPWRPYALGARIGRFRREVARLIAENEGNQEALIERLQREYPVDRNSAVNIIEHVQRQVYALGLISSDTTIVAEFFWDVVGEPRLVIHSPYGGRVNGAWSLALTHALRERTGVQIESQANDDGIIFRFPRMEELPPVELISLSPAEARERILRELPDSALFGAQFRMNAARALLLPRAHGRKRTPFWLQRLKARDLLASVRRFDDFPIVTETYRDCLRDVLDLPALEDVLGRLQSGELRLVPVQTLVPSPVASDLLRGFVQEYMYQWDAPKAERQIQALAVRREVLEDLLAGEKLSDLLKPEALAEVLGRLQHTSPGYRARSAEELLVSLDELGDLNREEMLERCTGDGEAWLEALAAAERAVEIEMPAALGAERRWVEAEQAGEYVDAFGSAPSGAAPAGAASERILRRFLRTHGPVTRSELMGRYALPEPWLDAALASLVQGGALLRGEFTHGAKEPQFCDPDVLEQIHRRTLALLRAEARAVPLSAFGAFLLRWQHVHPAAQLPGGADDVAAIMRQLDGLALPGVAWERDILPARLARYEPSQLDALCGSGEIVWTGAGKDPRRAPFRFFVRGDGSLFLGEPDDGELSKEAEQVYEQLREEGASFIADLWSGSELGPATIEAALGELVMSGLATNDTLEAMRRILRDEGPSSTAAPQPPAPSALEQELAQRRGRPGRAQPTSAYRSARRRVAARLREEAASLPAPGRWSLVHRGSVMGKPLSGEERAGRLARLLLARYGVVSGDIAARDAAGRDATGSEWGSLYRELERLEMRGEVRRGYFVAELSGAQFALPEAVEKLRAESNEDGEPVVVSAVDPALAYLLSGIEGSPEAGIDDGLRFARVPSTYLVIVNGRPALVAEDGGARLSVGTYASADLSGETLQRVLETWLNRPNAPRHVTVSQWNGTPVLGSAGERALSGLGFYRSPAGMELWTTGHRGP